MNAGNKQSSTMSFVEAATNVLVGFVLAVLTQVSVFPILGISVGFEQNLIIGTVFTIVSLLRSFTLRRLFEAFRASGGLRDWGRS